MAKLVRLEDDLHERVIGQDERRARGRRTRSAGRAPGSRTRTGRSARSCSSARRVSARPSSRARSPTSCSTTSGRWSASTCRSTWRSTRCRASSARRRATSATRRAASSPKRCGAARTRWSCSTRSRRRTPTCSTCCLQLHGRRPAHRRPGSHGRLHEHRRDHDAQPRRAAATRTQVMAAVRNHFKPEFLNRIDEIVVFHRLVGGATSRASSTSRSSSSRRGCAERGPRARAHRRGTRARSRKVGLRPRLRRPSAEAGAAARGRRPDRARAAEGRLPRRRHDRRRRRARRRTSCSTSPPPPTSSTDPPPVGRPRARRARRDAELAVDAPQVRLDGVRAQRQSDAIARSFRPDATSSTTRSSVSVKADAARRPFAPRQQPAGSRRARSAQPKGADVREDGEGTFAGRQVRRPRGAAALDPSEREEAPALLEGRRVPCAPRACARAPFPPPRRCRAPRAPAPGTGRPRAACNIRRPGPRGSRGPW